MVPKARRSQIRWITGTSSPGPEIDRAVEQLIVRMAEENQSWGHDRIVGHSPIWGMRFRTKQLAMFCVVTGYLLRQSASTRRPGRPSFGLTSRCWRGRTSSPWKSTLHGLVTYYVLFFIHLASRRVEIAGITTHPTEQWMKQMADRKSVV